MGMIFLVSLLPVCYLSFVNRASGDDLGYGTYCLQWQRQLEEPSGSFIMDGREHGSAFSFLLCSQKYLVTGRM